MRRYRQLTVAAVLWVNTWGSSVFAAINTATGTIGGQASSLTGSSVTIGVQTLELRKEIRDQDGNFLGTNIPAAHGSVIWFVIYVHNITSTPLDDLQLEDVVPLENFTLEQLAANVHTEAIDLVGVVVGDESKAVGDNWAAVWLGVTDAGGDHGNAVNSGEYDPVTQTFKFGTAGAQATIPANTLRAYRFKAVLK